MPTNEMIARKDGPIAWMIFNNPLRHNAVSLAMWTAAEAILDDFARDDGVRVIVLTGAGDKAFVSGADISKFADERAAADAVGRYNLQVERTLDRLQGMTKPTLAMIRGYCIGGGVGIALCCDLRIAAEDARFAIPAAKLGLGYGHEGLGRLVDIVGPAFAKELFFTARQFDAKAAATMGLVNRVLPTGELEAFVRDYAGTIAENAPLTITAVKQIVNELVKGESERDIQLCERLVADCFASRDYTEGRTAFMEKRKPVFVGH
ncbi:MAG: enoyl-CoA hydratase/isomerase family protein [Proteobacteria bacterium]|nr:enoyl-CoA hydratase/isomerase family protein [Pseudomonadota bacterium]